MIDSLCGFTTDWTTTQKGSHQWFCINLSTNGWTVLSGVLQGSVLSQILFIFMNHWDQASLQMMRSIIKFMDDAK